MPLSKHYPLILLIFTLGITTAIYLPGLSGLFLFDDDQNITNQPAIRINSLAPIELFRAALSSDSGPLKRPVSMLSFALNAYFTGMNPYSFKLVNLIIHLLNGILVYLASLLLFELYRFLHTPGYPSTYPHTALAVSALWLVHPLNLTTVLYVVQRMTSLSALFSFLGIYLYLLGRRSQIIGHPGMLPILSAFFLAWPLAIFSKESGILLPALLGVIELTILNFTCLADKIPRRSISGLFLVTVILPFIIGICYLIIYPQWLIDGYAFRPFTLTERLLTEARVLWNYIGLTIFPSLPRFGLYHDDLPLSLNFLEPISTLLAMTVWIIVLGAAIIFRRIFPFASFGILFFLVGHSLESTFIPLEIMHEHRNYLPLWGICVAAMYYLFKPIAQLNFNKFQFFLILSIFLSFGLITSLRAALWGNPLEYLLTDVQYHPNSPRVNYEAGRFLVFMCIKEEHPETKERFCNHAERLFNNAYAHDPNFLLSPLGILRIKDIRGAKPTAQEIESLRNDLATKKLPTATPIALTTLGQCVLHGDCHISLQLIDDLYNAALTNPTLKSNQAAVIHYERGIIAYRLGDLPAALHSTRIAFQTAPNNLSIGLNFIHLLLQAEQLPEAEKIVIKLRPLINFWTEPTIETRFNNYAKLFGQ